MNDFSSKFEAFENVFKALEFLRFFEADAYDVPGFMPPIFPSPDYEILAGEDLDLDDFIVTRLQTNPDDIEYYKMLEVNNDIPYLTDYKRYSLKPNLCHSNFIYRGQRKDYGSLKANLFRDEKKSYFLDDMIKVQEMTAFIAQHPLVQLLGIKGFDLFGKNTKFQANLYGLAQHYYNKTTVLDFSSSAEIAAFFATTKYDYASDSYLPIEDGYESTGVLYVLPISPSLSYNRIYGANVSSIGKQFGFQRPEKQLGLLVECSGGRDLIDHKYLMKFEFHHNRDCTNRIYESFAKGTAIAPSDPLEKYWRKYRDIKGKPFDVSNKAIELNLHMNPGETEESIREKLSSYVDKNGNPMFRLTNKEWPEFPREILEEYWKDIENGWWEDVFCENIFFPMDERLRKIDALMDLPLDPRYFSAFYE